MMDFILTPPLILSGNVGFSVLQAENMDSPESLVIDMAGWSALDLLCHWRSEIGAGLINRRDRACIVSGLAVYNGTVVPTEWWKVYFRKEKALLQYQVLVTDDNVSWGEESEWWERIAEYSEFNAGKERISQWTVAKKSLENWCKQCDALLVAVRAVEGNAKIKPVYSF